MKLTWRQYAAIGGDILAVLVAFWFGKWIGFAIAVLFVVLVLANQMLMTLQASRDVLLSRLPDRCALCHREILDDPGVLDYDLEEELKIYHEACSDHLDAMKEKAKNVPEA